MVSIHICIAVAINSDMILATICGEKKNQMPNTLHLAVFTWWQLTLLKRILWIPSFNLNKLRLKWEFYSTLSILTNVVLKCTDFSYLSMEIAKCYIRALTGKRTLEAWVTDARLNAHH